jgi:hypothetical protein
MTVIDNALTRPWTVDKRYVRNADPLSDWPESSCPENNTQVFVGKESYYLSGDAAHGKTRRGRSVADRGLAASPARPGCRSRISISSGPRGSLRPTVGLANPLAPTVPRATSRPIPACSSTKPLRMFVMNVRAPRSARRHPARRRRGSAPNRLSHLRAR